MARFDLVLNGVAYPVPRESVSPMLDHRPDLQNQESYRVQRPVSQGCFQAFVAAVRQGSEVVVGSGNVGDLTLLSGELCLEDLRDKCTALAGAGSKSGTDLRFGDLEWELRQAVEGLSSRVEALSPDIERLKEVHATKAELRTVKDTLESNIGGVQRGWEAGLRQLKEREVQEVKVELQRVSDSLRPIQLKLDGLALRPLVKIEIPTKVPKSLEGIISYLTKKHGGNVHEKGIVTITSKSVYNDAPGNALKNVADLTSDSLFASESAPGQWVCWDLRAMRVRPTHYTLWTECLKSSKGVLKIKLQSE